MKRIFSSLVIVLILTSTFSVHGLKKRKKRQASVPRCPTGDVGSFPLQSGSGITRCRTTSFQRVRVHVRQSYDFGVDAPIIFPEQSEPLEEISCTTSTGAQGTCKHPTSCVFTFDSVDDLETSTCRQSNNDIGICCSDEVTGRRQTTIPISIPASASFIPSGIIPNQITSNDLDDAGKAGQEALAGLQALELELKQLGLVVQKGTSTSFHQAFFGTKRIIQQLGNNGFVGLRASETLAKRIGQSANEVRDSLPNFSLKGTVANSVCPIEPPCPSTKYRTIDGSCNNLRNPTWGKSFTAFIRLLRPNYADGLSLPRIASDGGPLPSARDVSVKATPDESRFVFGMLKLSFLNYEIANDRQCFVFFLGLLRVSRLGNVDLLPKETDENIECQQSQGNSDFLCFKAGDERANEQIDLALLHTIWMREHNRVARVLAYYNPGWNDEILYQEGRRIVGAEMQHIVFNEFLPLLLGKGVMSKFRLLLKRRGHSTSYDPTLNPGIANAFSAAAYRYGHTLVQGTLNLIDKTNEIVDKVPIRDAFFNPSRLYEPGNLDRLLRGLVRQPSQRFDSFVTNELTNHLFQPPGQKFGMDLVALNIQRGRDHGIPGYNDWREHCGLPRARSFDDLTRWMNPNSVNAFKELYRNVDDIDLFPAGIAERSLPGATLGPTFACIAGDQFRRLKLGDRMWYENGNMESSFTERNVAEITEMPVVLFDHILVKYSDAAPMNQSAYGLLKSGLGSRLLEYKRRYEESM
ncbi:peroxidasin homolog [Limulus polyphemus]|uniref:Peroxidasin homolog n=1 Tax=Limulus polyphemus TaxID=6850 RepID=A0ABM1SNA0_LIMPO|nr:peroxidasin homolog [Limulus polyphemus]